MRSLHVQIYILNVEDFLWSRWVHRHFTSSSLYERLMHNNVYRKFRYFHFITSEQTCSTSCWPLKNQDSQHIDHRIFICRDTLAALIFLLQVANQLPLRATVFPNRLIDHNGMHIPNRVPTNLRYFPIWTDYLGSFQRFSTLLSYLELNSVLGYASATIWLWTVMQSVLVLRVFR